MNKPLIKKLRAHFREMHTNIGESPRLFFSPGRVNLIGEHTDYNSGYVLPAALSFGTYLLICPNKKDFIRFASLNFPYTVRIPLDLTDRKRGHEWVNYPLGVIHEIEKKGISIPGMDMLFAGDIPNGAGLSSSASIELVTAFALNVLTGSSLHRTELALLSQKAENSFVGMNCGIMDQFAVAMAQKEHALFLNCGTLEHESIPLTLGDYRLVICNTNERRGLTDTAYNQRRQECEQALALLRRQLPLNSLTDLSLDEFNNNQDLIQENLLRKRVRHVVSENHRVLEAIPALKAGHLHRFGQLMNASHESLKSDYEVTGKALDSLSEETRKLEGVLGSRMTGGGFGGCTVSLIHKDQIREFESVVPEAYTRLTGLKADIYYPEIGQGVEELSLTTL